MVNRWVSKFGRGEWPLFPYAIVDAEKQIVIPQNIDEKWVKLYTRLTMDENINIDELDNNIDLSLCEKSILSKIEFEKKKSEKTKANGR